MFLCGTEIREEGRSEDGERASGRAGERAASRESHLGHKLPVLLVHVGCRRHVVLPDADLALFGRSGQEEQKEQEKKKSSHSPDIKNT